jgi:cell division protein FtsB
MAMVKREKIQKSLRLAMGPAIAVLVLFAGIGCLVFGPTGLYAWGDYSQQLEERKQDLAALRKDQKALKNKVDLVDPQQTDPDMADELVRRDLNVSHPDEMIVPLK